MFLLPQRQSYSRAERLSDAIVHLSGLVCALMGVPVLITLSVLFRGEPSVVLGTALYGAALIAMLLCSTLYNTSQHPEWRAFFRKLDHSAIYIKIAATFTPFSLMANGQAAWLLMALWSAAILGMALRILYPEREIPAVALALAMGWAVLMAGDGFFATLSPSVYGLIALGGTIYTVGVAFFFLERLPFHWTIWHICVVAGSMLFFAAILLQVTQVP